jgi:PAS domain S-box-containing protein
VPGSLFQTTDDPIWGIDLQSHRVIDANPAALSFLGYSEEELFHKTLADLHPPEAVHRILSRCVPSLSAEFVETPYCAGVVPCKKKDGSTEPLDIRCYVIKFGSLTDYLYVQGTVINGSQS